MASIIVSFLFGFGMCAVVTIGHYTDKIKRINAKHKEDLLFIGSRKFNEGWKRAMQKSTGKKK